MALFKSNDDVVLNVTGMHCQKCVARVKDALEAVDGATGAVVELEEGRATVSGTADPQALVAAVRAIEFGCELA